MKLFLVWGKIKEIVEREVRGLEGLGGLESLEGLVEELKVVEHC